jgi:hypothetical protein
MLLAEALLKSLHVRENPPTKPYMLRLCAPFVISTTLA